MRRRQRRKSIVSDSECKCCNISCKCCENKHLIRNCDEWFFNCCGCDVCNWFMSIQTQKLRISVANFSLYFSQALSLCFCVYVGAGSQHFSLWLNLLTSLMGVIIGNEMIRLLGLYNFDTSSDSKEDVNEIDLIHSQQLLGTFRRFIGLVGALNALQVLFRLVVLGCFNFRNEEFLNVTNAINEQFPNLGNDLGLISCEVDCGMAQNTTVFDKDLLNAQVYCVERCLISQDMYAAVLSMIAFCQLTAFTLARLIVYGT